MDKLNIGTLSNVSISEIKELYKDSNDLESIKDCIRNYIFDVLKKGDEKKENEVGITKDEFYLMEGYIKGLKDYSQILEKYFGKNFSFSFVEKIIFGQNIEEFEKMCNNQNIKNVLINSKEKNLESVVGLCSGFNDFNKLCNNEYIVDILISSKEKNLESVVGLCSGFNDFNKLCNYTYTRNLLMNGNERYIESILGLSSLEDFDKLCKDKNKHEYLRNLLINLNEKYIEDIILLSSSFQEFSKFCDNTYVRNILINGNKNNIKSILGLCNSLDEFKKICNNENSINVLMRGKENNINSIIGLLKTYDDFLDICDQKTTYLLITGDETNINSIISLCSSYEDFKKLSNNINIYTSKFLQNSNKENVKSIVGLCNNYQDFELLYNNNFIQELLMNGKENNIKSIIGLCKDSQDFLNICNIHTIIILEKGNEKNIEAIIGLCNSSQDFYKLCNTESTKNILIKRNEDDIKSIVGLCNSSQDFYELCENEKINYILKYGNKNNIKSFLKLSSLEDFENLSANEYTKSILIDGNQENVNSIVGLCNSSQDFDILFNNIYIRDILIYGNKNNIKSFLKLSSLEDFENLSANEYTKSILIDGNQENVNSIVGLCNSSQDFDILFNNEYVKDILIDGNEKNINSIVGLCNSLEDFEKLFDNEYTRNILINGNKNNINSIIGLCNSSQDFKSLSNNEYVRNMLVNGNKNNIRFIIGLCNSLQDFDKLLSNKYVRNILIYGNESKIKLLILLSNTIDEFIQKCNNSDIQEYLKSIYIIDSTPDSSLQKNIFDDIIGYCVKYENQLLIDSIKKLSLIKELDLELEQKELPKTISYFIDKKTGKLDFDSLKKEFEEILKENNTQNCEKKLKYFDYFIENENIEGLEELFMQNVLKKFDNMYYKKIISELKKFAFVNLKEKIDKISKIDKNKFDNPDFINAFKMLYNKEYSFNSHLYNGEREYIIEILIGYLNGEFDEQEKLSPDNLLQYDLEKNKERLDKSLSQEQQKIWLSSNTKIFKNKEIENIGLSIDNPFELAIKSIEKINNLGVLDKNLNKIKFKTIFVSSVYTDKESYFNITINNLLDYFSQNILKYKDSIISLDKEIWDELELQIKNLRELNDNYTRKIDCLFRGDSFTGDSKSFLNKIKIEREKNPLKSLGVGKSIDIDKFHTRGSLGEYWWSSISNTIDVNKGVFNIADENGKIIARFIIAIGDNKKLSRYKLDYNYYYSGNLETPLEYYVDNYLRELANDIGLDIDINPDNSLSPEGYTIYNKKLRLNPSCQDNVKKINSKKWRLS
ncbi:hypothetical protein [Candidatus Vampirococcus lugosii]|uniref:Uncharacterized protein n=1 Tax=Candidatus Vampirococcus lugosii TaxID=2789015 RepID=A0ABS5QLI9_9BACT|nr:hypothetical protein [Candidatus Vampirococcus lugosii]MBS8121949.1 hypothetical protein [Candidatus Vampirococcus lugosii]